MLARDWLLILGSTVGSAPEPRECLVPETPLFRERGPCAPSHPREAQRPPAPRESDPTPPSPRELDPRDPGPRQSGPRPSDPEPAGGGDCGGLAALESEVAEIAGELAALAGDPAVRDASVRIVPRAEVAARARARVEREFPSARRAHDERIAKLLGMLPPDADLGAMLSSWLAEDVDGVLDERSGEVLLAEDADPGIARLVLAHELARRSSVLERADSPLTTDERLAARAVCEARTMWLVAAWVEENLDEREFDALIAEESRRCNRGADLPPFVWKPVLALYAQGQAFLARQARFGPFGATPVSADVARAFAAPPATSEELLHPARYWDPARREPATPVSFTAGALPAGWSVAHEDVLGELLLAIFVTPPEARRGLPATSLGVAQSRFTHPAAEGWDGDRVVLATREGAAFARLATRWESPEVAARFAAAATRVAEALELPLAVEVRDARVVVTAHDGATPAELAALDAALAPSFG